MTFTFPPCRIVVAVDGSGPGRAALRAAAGIAARTGASVEAVFAETPPVTVPYEYDALDSMAARAIEESSEIFKARWHETAREALKELPPERAKLTWLRGWPAEAILGLVRERKADLLVAGTHGRAGVDRFFLGSVAERLMRGSPVPILCVHERDALKGPILAPYNLLTHSDTALGYALDLGAASKRPVTVLYVAGEHEDRPDSHLESAVLLESGLAGRAGQGMSLKILRGEPNDRIAKEARRGGYGLIVLSSHVKPTLSERALGSTAERLLRHAPVAVLAVPVSLPSDKTGGRHGSLKTRRTARRGLRGRRARRPAAGRR